jgi:neutral ceramidase
MLPSCLILGLIAGSLTAAETPEWQAGAAKIVVTPRGPIWLGGYGARTKPSEGVLNDLYVSALALRNSLGKTAVIVSADTLGFTRPMADEIAARCKSKYGLERDRLMLNASHTHSAPLTGQLGRPTYFLPDAEAGRSGATRRSSSTRQSR